MSYVSVKAKTINGEKIKIIKLLLAKKPNNYY